MPKAARAIGCSTKSLYNKIEGTRPWKITDVIALSRLCNWTVAEFLDIIEYEEVWK